MVNLFWEKVHHISKTHCDGPDLPVVQLASGYFELGWTLTPNNPIWINGEENVGESCTMFHSCIVLLFQNTIMLWEHILQLFP